MDNIKIESKCKCGAILSVQQSDLVKLGRIDIPHKCEYSEKCTFIFNP